MVHLQPLPGSPRYDGRLQTCLDAALADATALAEGGVDGIIVENFHDVPFRKGRVDAVTVAAMTRVCTAIQEQVSCTIGVNVLRNDAEAALAVAVASGAAFIRVNVHAGVMATDQGLIEGRADETLRLRRLLVAEHVRIFADVLVKHAQPLGPLMLEQAVDDVVQRGLADAVIVSGLSTGQAASPEDVARAVTAAGSVPVYVGSGVTLENVEHVLPPAAGVIVGTSLKSGRHAGDAVDVARVRQLRSRIDQLIRLA
jgi:hypothetical protein